MHRSCRPTFEATRPVLLAVVLLTIPSEATGQEVRAGTDVRVSVGEEYPHVEPHLAIDPTDDSRLVAAAMALPAEGEGLQIRVYRSTDGGRSWTGEALEPRERDRTGSDADPWLVFSDDGSLLLSHLPGLVWRSDDRGERWEGPAVLPRGGAGGLDAPKMALDRTGGTHHGRVYVAAMQDIRREGETGLRALALLRSDDGGRSFDWPTWIAPNDFANKNGDLAVLPDGTVLATFHELFHEGQPVESPRYWSVRSTDGGRSFSSPSLIASDFISLSPYLAVDRSGGSHSGRIYTVWLGLGGDRNHYVAHSDDAGATWTEARALTSRTDTTSYPTPIAAAVSPEGTLGVFWAEHLPEVGAFCFDFRFAASTDGGTTFSEPAVVSDQPSCSDVEGNQRLMRRGAEPAGTTVADRFRAGGDYYGIVALPDGSFQVIWADSRTGTLQLWTDRIRVSAG